MVKLKRQTITFRNQPIGLIQRSNAVEQSFVSTAESINSLNKIVFDELAADAKRLVKKGQGQHLSSSLLHLVLMEISKHTQQKNLKVWVL